LSIFEDYEVFALLTLRFGVAAPFPETRLQARIQSIPAVANAFVFLVRTLVD
jgi:hypothetical protein